MDRERASVVVLAGPNGAGKTTAAPALLRDVLAVSEFVNPDVIAQGLSGFDPDAVALRAAGVMLDRLRELAARHVSFAFETTLASRSYARWLSDLIEQGYQVHLVYLWLASAALAVERVAERVRMGGHDVPEQTIRHRYVIGLRNFFRLYQPLATTWRVYDNSGFGVPSLIAVGQGLRTVRIIDRPIWRRIRRAAR